ncbi:MAG: hypothetical protein ACT4OI_06895 [Methanobacteriota archaeon]
MRDARKALLAILPRGRERSFPTVREGAIRLLPWCLIGAGVILALGSLVTSVQLLGAFEVTGSVADNAIASVAVNSTQSAYAEVFLRGAPTCDLAVFVLDAQEAATFLETQGLPADYLGCRQAHGVYVEGIALLVLDNPADIPVAYDIRVEFVGIIQPNALWVLPASVLLAGGGMIVVRRMLQGGLTRIVDELAEREALAPPIDRDRPRR